MADYVDVHAHFLPDFYVAAARAAGHDVPEGMPGWPPWSVDAHLAVMDAHGIGTSMLSISAPGVRFGSDAEARLLARQVNDYGAAVAERRPGRFGHFATLPMPDVDGALAELARALDELGSDGLAVETNAGGVYLGNTRYEPLWEEADRRAATIFVHPISPPGWQAVALGRPRPMLEYIFDSARTATDLVFSGVLDRYRNIRWIFTHGGGVLPLVAERIELFRTLFLGDGNPAGRSTQEQLAGLWYDLAGTPFPHQVPALLSAFGDRKVLYGSDFCFTPAPGVAAQIRAVEAADAPPGHSWRELTAHHAFDLFPRLRTATTPTPGPARAAGGPTSEP